MSYDIEKDWITEAGLRAAIIICKSGERKTHRCGYVAVTKEHPLFKVGYHEQAPCLTKEQANAVTVGKKSPIIALTATCGADSEDAIRRSPDIIFDVHGGLTYSGGTEEYPISAADLWWFGFDCRHAGDGEIEPDSAYPSWHKAVVRELPYVEAECESLARQLAAYA
jgi:hypothetical protein